MEKALQLYTASAKTEDNILGPKFHYDDHAGYILDTTQLDLNQSTKLAPDGQTALIPQPGDDPDNPLD